MALGAWGTRFRAAPLQWASPAALGLALATLVRYGWDANAFAWAAAQVLLVAIAAYDLATRRILNAFTVPGSVTAVALRVAFERSALVEVLIAGVAAFAAFFVVALVARGGFGMGDVKLAGMLGFLLGTVVFPALLIGTVAGGLVSVAIFVRWRAAALRRTIAYGPYLALGGAVAILAFDPPPLV